LTARAWRVDQGDVRVPVCRPRLPPADALLPYLRRIDSSQWYSNWGPLVRELEARLADKDGSGPGGHVVAVAGATAGLTAVLLSLNLAPDTLCMVPAWTFAATAHAIVRAGLRPWLVDVDGEAGALSAAAAQSYLQRAPGPVGAVVTVAPFGMPVDVGGWELFQAENHLPVVLDAAAGFDSVRPSAIPTVLSLHATKVLGAGEGGYVVWNDPDGIEGVRRVANFGFAGSREAAVSGLNAKMSEYTAAVALAALDSWASTRPQWERVARTYRAAVAGSAADLPPGYGLEWVSSTALLRLPPGAIEKAEDALVAAGVGSRRWWGDGLGAHTAFLRHARTDLSVTETLGTTVLGLPCWTLLPEEEIQQAVQLVLSVLPEGRERDR